MADYRQQSGGSLGNPTACPSCYIPIQLYYSAVSAQDLCCNVSTTSTYYLAPGTASFSAASVIYSNDTGTVASDGYYREN